MKRQKRPYLLLELMIAFSILSICAIPLVSNPLSLLRKQLIEIEEAEIAREAHVAFAEFKAFFLQNAGKEISREQLLKAKPIRGEKRAADFEESVTLSLLKKRSFQKKIFLWSLSEEQDGLRLVQVRISFIEKKKRTQTHSFNWVVCVKM